MADATLTFTPERLEQEAAACDQLFDQTDIWHLHAAMLRQAASTLRRLSAVEGQTCETCKFAGPEVQGDRLAMRRCYVLRGVGHQLVSLVNAQGEPHGCNSWQPRPAQETR